MKNPATAILATILLASSIVAHAVTIESSTSVYLTFRECIAGQTACDRIGATQVSAAEGLPGNQGAEANQEDPAYGKASGSTRLTGKPGASEQSGSTESLPGTRNGSTMNILQKYTNVSSSAETLTFSGTLSYEQVVPEQNAEFPPEGNSHSGAFGALGVLRLNVDAMEAGTTAEDNFIALLEGPEDVEFTELGSDETGPVTNVSETGAKPLSVTVKVNPGDSVWLSSGMQSISANGAVVSASLTTQLDIAAVE